jgi:type II secretory pathway pseudopilin PulG
MKTPNATTRFTQERGITLVEILVALVVIAFVLLGIAQVFPGSARGQVRDRMMRGATYLAQEKLEYLNTLSWGDAALIGGRHPTTGAETCGDNNAWTRYWQVTTLGAPLDNLKKVTVTVKWTAGTFSDSLTSITYIRR